MTSTYHNEIKLGEVNYRLSATTDSTESLVLDLLGSLDSGEVIADGRLRLPVEGGVTIGKLLARVLSAHTRLRSRPSRHANANQPWTEALDTDLRTGAVERLSERFGKQGNNFSLAPTISADGRSVVFSSLATNLSPAAHHTPSSELLLHKRL